MIILILGIVDLDPEAYSLLKKIHGADLAHVMDSAEYFSSKYFKKEIVGLIKSVNNLKGLVYLEYGPLNSRVTIN